MRRFGQFIINVLIPLMYVILVMGLIAGVAIGFAWQVTTGTWMIGYERGAIDHHMGRAEVIYEPQDDGSTKAVVRKVEQQEPPNE